MSEAELIRLNHNRKCTLYSIQFLPEDEAEHMNISTITLRKMQSLMET